MKYILGVNWYYLVRNCIQLLFIVPTNDICLIKLTERENIIIIIIKYTGFESQFVTLKPICESTRSSHGLDRVHN